MPRFFAARGKVVGRLLMASGFVSRFCPRPVVFTTRKVQKLVFGAQFLPTFFNNPFSRFLSVKVAVLPIFHTPNKNNNFNKLIIVLGADA